MSVFDDYKRKLEEEVMTSDNPSFWTFGPPGAAPAEWSPPVDEIAEEGNHQGGQSERGINSPSSQPPFTSDELPP
jgi:hypothetical protein